MSDVSTTAPIGSRQIVRALVLMAVLGGCTWTSTLSGTDGESSSHWVVLLHLLAVSSWFGCSVWVSFIAGIIMFQTLPRHTFGRLQSKLFPAYFVFSAGSIALAIATSRAVVGASGELPHSLIAILATVLLNLFYFEPATTRVMYQRHAVEKRLGTGHEIGKLRPDDPQKANDPQLKALTKTFGMLHGISTLLNLAALGFGCVWLSRCAERMVLG
mmetsp:Transcript_26459/g.72747  ORF Transcript_26459/g.72747 Transcript_26459/m.72747 type:complete len:215 (+) Transcript_26459:185-829(+)|eukprot:CAMPEP_0172373004 /NCGR_PEP_ID=MMETSP1060-20121228/50094_1 /TAXON_ID=37318 /ORGANISM="Pseudo-nitzschia pungens, Strain cf. cingulata" /LENGTH=214 /DNA_ID=CAMNT_0013099197 /DNA_START=172 /DNA_END=816 /DNA_ORIENTATION=-